MSVDFEHCYRAVQSRDSRFDGAFYTAVTSTGIYCRPSCPALTPRRANVRFYRSAAAAQGAGFRACKRCRPDAVPGSPEWNVRADLVGRAMRLIADGVVDRDGVPALARQLGYSERHLHRQLVVEVGAGPLALARSQRAHTARLLLQSTGLPVSDIAFAAGFASIRQFNDTVQQVFAMTPTALRTAALDQAVTSAGSLTLRLPFRTPYDGAGLLAFLRTRAVPGVEQVDAETYRRTLVLPHGTGLVALTPRAEFVHATLSLTDLRDLAAVVARCRRLLDLDADPIAVADVLAADRALAPVVTACPGRRVPGAVDGDELAIRAVLGQQVSVAAARTAAGRLVERYGDVLPAPHGSLTHTFPSARSLARAEDLAMPQSRARALRGLCAALADGSLRLDPGVSRAEVGEQLRSLPGIGPWTAQYIAMRALGDPDAFLATDLGVRKGAAALGITDLDAHSPRWRPWRSYAVQHLWHLPHPPKET